LNIVFDLAGVVVNYDQAALIAAIFPDPAMHATVRTEILGHVDRDLPFGIHQYAGLLQLRPARAYGVS
jgi:hypothetical protein